VEVLLGSFDGFMQNCDFQIDSFRAYLLEFLELQVSDVRDRPEVPAPGTPRRPGGRWGRPGSLGARLWNPGLLSPIPYRGHISLGGGSLGLPAPAPTRRGALPAFLSLSPSSVLKALGRLGWRVWVGV
jgi:hypothetical protein